jgi:hypothetical protein
MNKKHDDYMITYFLHSECVEYLQYWFLVSCGISFSVLIWLLSGYKKKGKGLNIEKT